MLYASSASASGGCAPACSAPSVAPAAAAALALGATPSIVVETCLDQIRKMPGGVSKPALPDDTNYLLCEVCVLIDLNYDPARGYGAPAFLALGGSVTVTRADRTPSGGRLEAIGSNLDLVEWDFAADRPSANNGCYHLDTLAISGSYVGDGGDPPRWKGGP